MAHCILAGCTVPGSQRSFCLTAVLVFGQDEMIEMGEKEAAEALAEKEAAETAAHAALMKGANLEVRPMPGYALYVTSL